MHYGCCGYYFQDWVGPFYPRSKNHPEYGGDRLQWYQRFFRFVEINTTFYRPPLLQSFIDIQRRSVPQMLYAIKLHRDVSHDPTFNRDKSEHIVRNYIQAISPLLENGHFFSFILQLHDREIRRQKTLDYLLAVCSVAVSRHVDVHIEFRHNSWHTYNVLQSLKDAGIGICNTDLPPLPHAFPLKSYATTDKGYIRYNGRNHTNWNPGRATTHAQRITNRNARYDFCYSHQQLRLFARQQKQLLDKTAQSVAAYNNHYKAQAVANALLNANLFETLLSQEQTV